MFHSFQSFISCAYENEVANISNISFYNAVSTECLLKRGFGLSQTSSYSPVPVDTLFSYSIDLDGCQTKCDTLVWGLFNISM